MHRIAIGCLYNLTLTLFIQESDAYSATRRIERAERGPSLTISETEISFTVSGAANGLLVSQSVTDSTQTDLLYVVVR